ncbi:hypothetical protein D3C87_769080 [compost metagenome]
MKSRISKKDLLVYIISLLFTLISIYLLVNGDGNSEKELIINLNALIFFGGGGLMYFFLKNNFGSKKIISVETKIIYESKIIVFFSFLIFLVFVTTGIIMIVYDSYFDDPQFVFCMGIICVSLFGLFLFVTFKRLIYSKRKLIEITESTLNIQIGFLKNEIAVIPKNEVIAIKHGQISSNDIIAIYVSQPEKYIKKGFLKNTNNKITGTPININPINTNFSSDEILNFLIKNITIEN